MALVNSSRAKFLLPPPIPLSSPAPATSGLSQFLPVSQRLFLGPEHPSLPSSSSSLSEQPSPLRRPSWTLRQGQVPPHTHTHPCILASCSSPHHKAIRPLYWDHFLPLRPQAPSQQRPLLPGPPASPQCPAECLSHSRVSTAIS